jgi:hypothetical protein
MPDVDTDIKADIESKGFEAGFLFAENDSGDLQPVEITSANEIVIDD